MTTETQTYRVETYPADGHSEPVEVLGRGLTLEQAREMADMGHGGWSGGEEAVGAYHASDADGCGGRVIVRDEA